MKYAFYVFSGSGNTDKVCRKIEQGLISAGAESSYWKMKKGTAYPKPSEADAIVLGFPVHAFNAPTPVIEFAELLSDGQGRKAYLVATSGEPLSLNDCSFIRVRKMLERKNYRVTAEYRYVMPYNIIFRHSDGMASRMWRAAENGIKSAISEMLSETVNLKSPNLAKKALSEVFKIEHAAMPIIGRSFRVTDGCIGCGACERVCPQANISIENGRPVFGKNCVGCMGCAFTCPADAIRTGILNGWRVNGKYSFEGKPAEDEQVCNYFKKTYLNYFHKMENMIK